MWQRVCVSTSQSGEIFKSWDRKGTLTLKPIQHILNMSSGPKSSSVRDAEGLFSLPYRTFTPADVDPEESGS